MARRLALILLLAFSAVLPRAEGATFQGLPLNQFELDNGLRVWHLPRHESPSVAIALVVRAGGRYENGQNNGVSHFLEHFLFTETERWSEGEVFQVMNRLGGVNNATTERERTTWYNVAAREYFEPAMDWIAEVVLHSKMAEKHIEKERQVIFQENGGPDSWFVEWCNDIGYGVPTTEELYARLYPGSKFDLPIIGQNASLEAMDHEMLTSYYEARYRPDNAVLLVVGSIELAEVEAAATHHFGAWERKGPVPWPEEPPLPDGPIRIVQRGMDLQDNGAVWVGARTGGIPDPARWPLAVMGHILQERLFQRLRIQEGLVYHVGSAHAAYSDVGDFRVVARAKREHLHRVEEAVQAEFEAMKQGNIAPEEIVDAKTNLIGRHALAMESNYSHAFALIDYTHLPEYGPIPDHDASVNAVTAADIQQVAQEYFTPERSYVVVYDPVCTVNELAIYSAIATFVAAMAYFWRRRRNRSKREADGARAG